MTEQILQDWLDGVKKDLIKNYDNLGLRASGNWAKKLETFIEDKTVSFRIGIIGEQYTGAIESGRSSNKNQSEEAIRKFVGWAGSTFIADWIKNKGLTANPYAVAYKIAREGWNVPNRFNKGGLLTNVITNERLNELNNSLFDFYVSSFRSNFIKELN